MFEYNEELRKIDFSHNPFSMPQGGLESLENADPLEIKAFQYDIVCNGVELSSGAIRNHRQDILLKAFEIAGYDIEEIKKRFGAMYDAFGYGAPPHGGIAPGIDRIVMLIARCRKYTRSYCFPYESASSRSYDECTIRNFTQISLKNSALKLSRRKNRMGLKSLFLETFTWWNNQTLSTKLLTLFRGKFVGKDTNGKFLY